MTLLARNGFSGFPKSQPIETELISMENVGSINPFSSRFEIPAWVKPTAYSLVMYLKYAHEKHGLSFGEAKYHLQAAKSLLEDYELEVIVRGIWLCSTIAKHPYSLKMVRAQIEKER